MVHARRKTPEELPGEAERHEVAVKKGYLKIFLSYASGVGKSFRMLERRVADENVARMLWSVPFSTRHHQKYSGFLPTDPKHQLRQEEPLWPIPAKHIVPKFSVRVCKALISLHYAQFKGAVPE
jgi:hypothetical protein